MSWFLIQVYLSFLAWQNSLIRLMSAGVGRKGSGSGSFFSFGSTTLNPRNSYQCWRSISSSFRDFLFIPFLILSSTYL